MKLKEYNKLKTDGRMLKIEIEKSNSIEGFAGMTYKDNIISVYGKSIKDEEILDHVVQSHNYLKSDLPKILRYQIDKNKNFQAINHKTELTISLDKDEIYGQDQENKGLLIKKEYKFEDELIFFIEYDYRFNVIGNITHQKLTIKWVNEDGQINDSIKDKRFKRLSNRQIRGVVMNRRNSLVMLLEIKVMELLSSNASNNEDYIASVNVGAELMSEVSAEIDKFKNSGNPSSLINKLNILKSETKYSFLNNQIVSGVTVIDFIGNFLKY